MGTIGNIGIEPVIVTWNGVELGFLDGDVEVTPEEQLVDITAHQEGTNILGAIRTGKNVSVTTNIKETSTAQINTLLAAGGGSVGAVAQITSITTVADVSGSLNNKVFYVYDHAGVGYAVWMNVNAAGTDPSIPGFTSVAVTLATSATADAVGDAVATALDALASFAAPNPAANVITLTGSTVGAATTPDAGNTGFTVSISTPGTNLATGWGNSKDFTDVMTQAAKLVLHPVVLDAAVKTRDITFWKAYPMVDSIVKSGENINTVSISWRIFPDTSQASSLRLFSFGDHA